MLLAVFANDSIKRGDCVPALELRCRLSLTSPLVERRLRRFDRAARRLDGELLKDLLLPTPHSHVAQVNLKSAEDVGNYDQDRPGITLQTASLQLRTMEKVSSGLA